MEMEVRSSRDSRKYMRPIGCSSAKDPSELISDDCRRYTRPKCMLFRCSSPKDPSVLISNELYRFSKDIFSAKGALKLLGVELCRACKENSDQQQDIGELLNKRVAATGLDLRSISTMMMWLAVKVDKEDVVAFCLGRGAVVDRPHLEAVACSLSFASHRKMIEAKAVDINCIAGWHGDILSVAVDSNIFEWAKFCLENGALPNISLVDDRKLVIARAAEEGCQAMVELLLEFGAELPRSGAMVLAAAAGQAEMVRWLLSKGADVNEVGASPHRFYEHVGTPLHQAITFGHKETAKLLIENGANLGLRDRLGRTPTKLVWLSKRVTSQGATVPVTGEMGLPQKTG